MAKRRVKKRSQVGANSSAAAGNGASKPGSRAPKSMVIRVGASEVGQSVSQLVKDVRSMMEPHTASRLKERRSNKLRDFTTMAGPLGVTHLFLFSKSENGNTNLRLALTPRGPTFHFRIQNYSLCKDIFQSMKRPKSGGKEFMAPPLLVMNNCQTRAEDGTDEAGAKQRVPKHLESLATSVFQSLFPAINPTTTIVKGIKRVLLLDRLPQDLSSDAAQYVINLRHYAIETRTAKSVPKALRRLDAAEKLAHAGQKRKRNGLPNLGKLSDVSDYLLDPQVADGFTSASESEPDTDAEVEILAADQRRKKKQKSENGKPDSRERGKELEKKAIKLHELGPRMKLRLTKVEEGVCSGKVMWHEYIHKSKEEIRHMEKSHEARRQEKERRKAEQRANIERKRAERKANGQDDGEEDDDPEMMEDDDDEWDDDDDNVDGGAGLDDGIVDEDEEMEDAE